MSLLHETTQRRVCRVLFLLCCVAPLCGTLAWCAYHWSPWSVSHWENAVAQRLGGTVEAAGLHKPRPGVTTLDKLTWRLGPEGHPAATLEGLQIRGSQVAVEACSFDATLLLDTVRLLGTSIDDHRPLTLSADTLRLLSPTGDAPVVLTKAEMVVDAAAGGRRPFTFHCTSDTGAVSLSGSCATGGQQDVRLSINSEQSPLPCWALGSLGGWFSRLGPAQFAGTIAIQQTSAPISGSLQGEFHHLPTQLLLGEDSTHQLMATGRLAVDELAWSGGRLQVAEGTLHAGRGGISESLLAAAVKGLHCIWIPESSPHVAASPRIPFDALAIDFRLDEAGVMLTGRCDADVPGCLVAHRRRALLLQPRYERLTVAELVQTVAPPGGGWLPATEQAQRLARSLPLPQAEKSPQQSPGGTLR